MGQKVAPPQPATAESGARGLSQIIFVLVVLAIIVAGLWSLYMGEAPYHPDVTQSDTSLL